ncbi:hypothetical protein [Candidatus Uabimicrobium amorphum]|uniref:Deoxyribonuclease n=1 Tax=Uabimicrobium amorphum TaxID=2596890 RepID=A0A5S9IIC6_UABAM|nr:hypothetical protein [Candidatus Uabimicrobium amorphum]BBM82016.1 deoxyribonuclease [Candidatus Uabimicrobium amorphum]
MRYLIFTIVFLLPVICDTNIKEAELLENAAANYTRMAENHIAMARVLEKRPRKAAVAQQHRKQAMKFLQRAQENLDKAIVLRTGILKKIQENLVKLDAQKRNSVRIASWNIQNFGESKTNKIVPYKNKEYTIPEVVADIIYSAKFDVIAIQEVEGDNLESVERVVEVLNMRVGEEAYRLTYPEKMGVSSNTAEFLPIVYDNRYVRLKTQGMLRDLEMQRPPHYALFELRDNKFKSPQTKKNIFDFCLVSVHLAPKASGDKDIPRRNDFKNVPKIFRFLNKKFAIEDIIVAGDFNCDPNRRGIDGELWAQIRKKKIVVHPITLRGKQEIATKTMTYGQRVNDNMIWMGNSEEDWAQTKEVYEYDKLHFQRDGKVDTTSARVISDHLPVWGKFYATRDSR